MGIIHRDIKAENVLINRKEGGVMSVKVIDFGFSKMLKHNLAGSFLGTGGYIAPEIRQQKQYSRSVDMWACGVLMYVILSGDLLTLASTQTLTNIN
jgi:serine/threonine protein kinase